MEKEKILKKDVVEIMKESYIDYAMSVIVSRALPDVRDGLKPVQRRILYTMYEMGLKHNAKFRKSASIVGECFVKDTLVLTERGLIPIQEIKIGDLVYTQKGLRKVIRLYRMPPKPLLKVTLENGISNIVTPSQKFKVLTPDWKFEWKEAKNLTKNDFLLVKADYPEINNYVKLKRIEKKQPLYLTENIAYLLGLFISDGWITKDYSKKKLPRICFTTGPDREVAEKIVSIFKKEFNYTPTIETKNYPFLDKEGKILNNKIHIIRINNKKINEFFVSNFSLNGVWAKTKTIPKQIFSSPKSVIFSFISGLIEGDGYLSEKRNLLHYGSISEKLIDQLMILLLSQGIFSEKYVRKNLNGDFLLDKKIKGKHKYYYLEITGKNACKLASFLEMLVNPEKKKRAIKIANNKKSGVWTKYEILPYAGKILFQELSKNHLGGGWYQDVNGKKFRMGIKYPGGSKIRYSSDLLEKPLRKTQVIEWGIKNKLERMGSPFFDFLKEIIENKIYFLRVSSIKKVAPRETYDLEVELDHEFVANGVVSHNCMGKYHPHGDAPVYEALVRMAQDFSLRYPLVLGQGNFGSQDDPSEFAAMRYTEAKLSKLGEEMLRDIEKDTVDFSPNYDGTRKEPQVLPSPLPQILLNGSLGIAVGMATNIPPHNLTEIVDALIFILKNENAKTEDILKFVKGPDFPTGGELYFKDDQKEIYRRGQGQMILRAKARVEGNSLIVTELPYLVKKSELLMEIAEKVKEGKITGIKLIRDESDREGIRILIEPQKGISPHSLLEILYQNTNLQKVFNLNFVVLVSGVQPKLVSLIEILKLFLDHRKEIVVRRTKYDLKILKEEVHILEGIRKCLGKIDKVISIIKKSPDRKCAQKKLMEEFSLDEVQANAILETKLASLAKLEREKIEKDFKEKKEKIEELSEILKSPKKIKEIIEKELRELKEKFGDKRRTEIKKEKIKILDESQLILPEETILILDKNKNLKRLSLSLEKLSEKRKKGLFFEKEEISKCLFTNTQNQLLLFSNQGRVFKIPVFEIPEKKGKSVLSFIELAESEEICEVLDLEKEEKAKYFVILTKNGFIKKLAIESVKNIKRKGLKIISLKKDDTLASALKTSGENLLLLATKRGQVIIFKERELREMGRGAEGVRGIRLKKDDFLISMLEIEDLKKKDFYLLFCSEKGFLKRVSLKEFKIQKRGGIGIRGTKTSEKTGGLALLKLEKGEEDLFLLSKKKIFKIKVSQIPKMRRESQGKKMIKLEEDDLIVSGTLI